LKTYQLVVTQYPKSYAAPFAAYSEGEILLRRFLRDEAQRSFNMVVTQFPQSPAARMASSQLARLGASQPPRASVAEPAVSAQPVQ
jgi:TolA-binding protein